MIDYTFNSLMTSLFFFTGNIQELEPLKQRVEETQARSLQNTVYQIV